MNNWMSRIAIFAVIGAILSSAILAGCGSKDDASTTTTTTTNKAAATDT